MLASITNTLANIGAKRIDLGGPLFNEAVATASASVASIGVDKVYGTHMSAEEIAANALGTFICGINNAALVNKLMEKPY